MKHLSKKVLIIIIVIAIIATATVVFFACQSKSAATPPPKNGHTVSMAPPEDGTSPEDYEGLDNLAFLAGRLSARPYFHSENTGLVDTIAKQNVVGTKDYSNGILITQSVSTSAFASVAQQKFYGEGKVVIRGPKYDKGKWDGIHTEWSDEKPVSVLDEAQYLEAYGLWADEFSDYVLNSETVSAVSDLSRDEKGNFVQTFTLEPAGATYYYKRQMRTMGNLGDYPSFSSVQITFTFDDAWSLLQTDIVEQYKVSVSVLNVSCTATSSIVYSYDESAVDVSAYESYFKKYADAPVTGGGEKQLSVVDYLQQGFAGYLAEPSTFELNLFVNGEPIAGRVTLDLANGFEIRAALGDLLLNVESDSLYVQYKELTGKLALSDLTSLLGGGFAGVDPDALMEQLAAGNITKDGENVTIDCALELAGLKLPLTFRFLETESGVAFVDVSASLEFGTIKVDASFAPAQGGAVGTIDKAKAVDLKPYIDSVFEIINSKSFTLALGYDNAELGLSVAGELYIDALRPALRGEIALSYAGLDIPVRFVYLDQTIYLQVFNIKLKTSQEYLAAALDAALDAAGVTLPDLGSIDLNAAISAIITADYDALIQKLQLTDDKLSLIVDLDAVLADMNIGELSANFVPAENAFGLSVYGVSAKLQGVTAREVGGHAGADEYISLELFENFVQPVLELANTKDIAFRFAVDTTIENIALSGEILGEVKFENALEVYLQIMLNGKSVEVLYRDSTVYLGFAGQKVKLAESELNTLAEKLSGLFKNAEGEKDLLAFFSAEGLNLQALLESIRLTGVEENGAAILNLFVDLGILNENLSDFGAKVTTDGHKLFVSAIQPVDLFGVSLSKLEASVFAAENEYTYDFENSVDLKPYLDSIYKLVEEQSFEITADYANAALGLTVNGTIYANVKNRAVSGELTVLYAGLTIPVNFTYVNKKIYLQVYNIKLQTTTEYAAYAIESALQYFNVTLPSVGEINVTEILGAVISADYSKIVKQFEITDESLSLTLDMEALIADMNIGDLSANFVPADNAFGLSVYGVSAKLQGVTAREVGAPSDADEYVSLELFEQFVEPVFELTNTKDIAFRFAVDTTIENIALSGEILGEVKFENALEVYLQISLNGKTVEVLYRDNTVYLGFVGQKVKLAESELNTLAEKLSGLFKNAEGEKDLVAFFSTEGLDLQALLESIRLTGVEENGAAILNLFVDLGILNENLSDFGAKVTTDGNKLFVSAIQPVDLFGVSLSKLESSVFAAENEYTYDFANSVDLKPYLDSIYKLVEEQSFEITANYENAALGLTVNGTIYANVKNQAVSGELTVLYAGLTIPINFTYINKNIYLQVYNVKVQTTTEYAAYAIESALQYFNVTLPRVGEINVTEVLGAVISADYSKIFKQFTITDESLSLTLDMDALIADMSIGELSANFVPAENAFALSVYGVSAKLQGVTAREVGAPADADEYVSLELFENFVQPVLELANTKDIAFRFAVDTTIENIALSGEIFGEVKFENSLEVYLQISLNGKTVEVLYRDNTVYLGFVGQKVKLSESELNTLAEKLSGLFNNAEGEKDLLAFFSAEGIDMQALLESIRLTGVEENGAAILNLFVDLGILNENLSDFGAKVTTDGHKLFVSAIQPVDLFGISLSKLEASVFAAENEYAYDFANSVDLKPYLDSIYKLVEEQSFEITAEYANAELGLTVNGTIYANVKNQAVSGELTVLYAGLTIPVNFTYVNKNIYLQVYNVKVQTTTEYAAYAIESALQYFNVTLPSVGDISVTEILGAVISVDYSKIVKQFTITDESLSLTLDMDALIADMNLGDLSANFVPAVNSFALSVYGVSAKLQGVTAREVGAPADTDEYVSLELFEKFIEPVQNLAKSDDIALTLEFGTKIHDIDMTVALSAEIKRVGQNIQVYLKAEIFVDGYADEVIELTYLDDYVTLVYEGKMMRVPVSQLNQLAQKLGGLFSSEGASADKGLQAAILLFSEDGLNLQAFLESLRLAGRTEEGKTVLGLFADLGLLDDRLSQTEIEIATDGQRLSVGLVGGTIVYGLPVNRLAAALWPAANEFPYDFSGAEECANVFEFALNAYVALFDTQYLNVSAIYESELLQANVSGLFEFVPASDVGTELAVNFDLRAEIHTFAYNEAMEKIDAGSHYLNMVAVGETAYISYSLYGYNAETALYVSLPVEQLYKIGNMILPIMGLDASAPYYDLIDHLLSAGETQFTTGIFSAIQFADLLKLLDGIPQAQGVSNDGVAALSENLSLFAIGANENGDISFTLGGLSVGNGETLSLALTAQKAGTVAADTSKTYIDITSVSLLFEDLLHAYEYTQTGYELKGSLGLSLLGIDLDLTVNIDLKVGVEADGTPYLNVNLQTAEYQNYLVWGFFGNKCIVDGNAVTDITFRDGTIYMTRLRTSKWNNKDWAGIGGKFVSITPEYLYRKMTLETFAGDAMDQIFFAINLSDGAKSYISKQVSSSGGGTGAAKDAGEMVKGYSFANNVHSLTLDVGAIAGDSALGELTLNITRGQLDGRGYYDLVKLDGTMKLVSVITMKFNLTHESCGNAVDFSVIGENIARVDANVA